MMSLLSSFGLLFIEKVHAVSPYFAIYCDALGTYCGDGQGFIAHLAVRTANVLVIPFVGGVAVIAILWASVKMMTSWGNDQGKEDAKKIITMALVGIALAVVGVAVVRFVCFAVQAVHGGSSAWCLTA